MLQPLLDKAIRGEARVDFGYDADVVYHEFGHWVVSRIADVPFLASDDIGMEWAGGSLNEGVADVFAMVLTGNPELGEHAGGAFDRVAIRELEADRRCPDDLAGQVHRDGQVLGALGWNLIESLGPEKTSDVFFGAATTWGPDVTWDHAGRSLVESASDLAAAGALTAEEADRVEAEVIGLGLVDCGRIKALPVGQPTDMFVLSAGLEGDLYRIPGSHQIAVDVPADATALVVDVTDFSGTDDGLGWSVYLRSDAPIGMTEFDLSGLGLGFSVAETYDAVFDGEDVGRVRFTAADGLVPGRTHYLAVAGRDLGPIELFAFTLGRMTLQLDVESAPAVEQPGGCATAPSPTGAWFSRR